MSFNVMIFAGEASGDMYGGRLAEALLRSGSDFSLSGIGGDAMAGAGVDLITHIGDLSVMGFWEVMRDYRRLRRILRQARGAVRRETPDAVILVDFYRFNIEIAREAKKMGIPVLYYVAPKLWAWGSGRIRTLKKYVDRVLAIFPFEEEYFRSQDMPVTFVGNPLIDLLEEEDPDTFRSTLNIEPDDLVISLLPGSRIPEVSKLLPVFLSTARLVLNKPGPNIRFIMPLAHTVPRSLVDEMVQRSGVRVDITDGNSRKVLGISDAAIVASGTATLEAFLLGVPQIVAYKASWLSFFLFKRFIRMPRVSLPNILCQRDVVEEFLQKDANADNLAEALWNLLESDTRKDNYRLAGRQMRKSLQGKEAPQLVALATLDAVRQGHGEEKA